MITLTAAAADKIKQLMAGQKPVAPAPVTGAAPPTPPPIPAASAAPTGPAVPAGLAQQFIPSRGGPAGATLLYRPRVLAAAKIHFADAKRGVDTTTDVVHLAPIVDGAIPVDWDKAETTTLVLADLEKEPQGGGLFEPLPADATKATSYTAWKNEYAAWLFRNATLDLRQTSREQRDAFVEKLRAEYAPKVQRLEEKVRNATQAIDREQGQARAAQLQTVVSVGATVLGALMGRKGGSRTLDRATTAARGAGRSMKQQEDVGRAKEDLAAAQHALDALNAEIEQKTSSLDGAAMRPSKSDIDVRLVTLAWAPYWRDAQGVLTAAWA